MASFMLVLAAPLLVGCAIWIRWQSGETALYRQWRVGENGRLFQMYKLRTMACDAEKRGVQLTQRGDPRVLPGCQWLRQCHIDELPQLLNVIVGDMSLVGPRPERPEIIEQLRHELPRFEQRLAVAPGLTGLAQLRQGYGSDLPAMRRKLACDLFYIRHRRGWTDVLLLMQTLLRPWDHAAC